MKKIVVALLLLLCAFSLFAQEDGSRALIAEITSAPRGTQYKTSTSQWMTASVGQDLYDNYQTQVSYSIITYAIELYGYNHIEFPDGPTTVTVGSFTGSAEYKDSQGTIHKLSSNSTITTIGICGSSTTTIPVSITGTRTIYKPKGWDGRNMEE